MNDGIACCPTKKAPTNPATTSGGRHGDEVPEAELPIKEHYREQDEQLRYAHADLADPGEHVLAGDGIPQSEGEGKGGQDDDQLPGNGGPMLHGHRKTLRGNEAESLEEQE